MRKKFIIFLYIGSILLLSGCSKKIAIVPATASEPSATTIPTATPARSVTTTVIPASTPETSPTKKLTPVLTFTVTRMSTALPTPTAVHSDTNEIEKSCIEGQSMLPVNLPYTGTLLLMDTSGNRLDHFALYHLPTGDITPLSNTGGYAYLSPDRTKFALRDTTTNTIDIFSSQGQKIKSLPWKEQEQWCWIERWLDNETILVVTCSSNPKIDQIPPTVIAVKPFANHTQTLSPEFPEIETAYGASRQWWPYSWTIYHPDMKRVVYWSSTFGYILYGIPENTILARFGENTDNPPIWSPDGSKLIAMGNVGDDFHLVDYDGAVSRITEINQVFDSGAANINFAADYYAWSPDNRHIAFWLQRTDGKVETEDAIETLAILDTTSGRITDYCIPKSNNLSQQRHPPYPVWSPDGKRIVIETNFGVDENNAVLIDLENQRAYKIASDYIPLGWLISP